MVSVTREPLIISASSLTRSGPSVARTVVRLEPSHRRTAAVVSSFAAGGAIVAAVAIATYVHFAGERCEVLPGRERGIQPRTVDEPRHPGGEAAATTHRIAQDIQLAGVPLDDGHPPR